MLAQNSCIIFAVFLGCNRMDFGQLLTQYGYIVVFLITILNLSTVLVLAGFAVHEGFLNIYWTIVVGALGSVIFSNIYFIAGRMGCHKFLTKHPQWQEKMDRFHAKIKHPSTILISVFLFRFVPGFRVITPFLVGPLPIGFIGFFVADAIGAIVWAIVFVGLGYYFGALAKAVFKEAEGYEWYVIGVIIVITVIWWLFHHYYKKYKAKKTASL